ncbi:hypothetical protein G7Y89_g10203 [Cudoniella acicularis]|uniref:Uncharacterized protein n=1 Tax=Cudoniella acicularis TaxID=354080 RepID=A0A8H4RFI2_9HELO|nr:hypothetical protein G7Y89_g10203 [Cudoniella acicularis]
MSFHQAPFIIAIDFGTTNTSVAFSYVEASSGDVKEDALTQWSGGDGSPKPEPQIPNTIFYNQSQNIVGWGPYTSNALAPTGYPKVGVLKFENIKLSLIMEESPSTVSKNLPTFPEGKTAVDVVADFLQKLRTTVRSELLSLLGNAFAKQEHNIQFCFTIPPTWNNKIKLDFRRTIVQAGYIQDINDSLLVVDCGDGTCDLASYEIPKEDPTQLREYTATSGDICGSTTLNRNFRNLACRNTDKMKLPPNSKTAARIYWKYVGLSAEFPEAGIEEGYMVFQYDKVLACFEPVFKQVLELINDQVGQINRHGGFIENILIVGPFARSEYLFETIKASVPANLADKIVRPADNTLAKVKGALIAGRRAATKAWMTPDEFQHLPNFV